MDQAASAISTKELVLKGELFIQQVAELKEELQASLDQADSLMINLLDVTEVDLAALQLLCSVRCLAVRLNKKLGLIGPPAEGVKSALRLAGYATKEKCNTVCSEDCIWKDDGTWGLAC